MTEPLVPADVDLRDFPSMLLDVVRLRDSELVTHPDGEVFRCNVLSWCVAWHQVPAASLPDDEATLARLLGYGRDLRTFRKVRAAGGLRGWLRCDDGRLYHPVVAEKAVAAWEAKQNQRQRTEAARNARLQRQQQAPSQSLSQSADTSVTEPATESKGREGKGSKENKDTPSLRSGGAPNANRPADPRGSRLPDGWLPSIALRAWALNELPESLNVEAETDKFRDYWRDKPGKAGRKVDWDGTWRNWMRRAAEDRKPRQAQQQHRNGWAALAAETKSRPAPEPDLLTIDSTARRIE